MFRVIAVAMFLVASACAGGEPKPPKGELKRFPQKLPTGQVVIDSTAKDVNTAGQVVGHCQVESDTPGLPDVFSFFWDPASDTVVTLPVPKDWSDTDVSAVSNSGLAVCTVRRDFRRYRLHQKACVWDSRSGEMTDLPTPPDSGSTATGISADGHRVVGHIGGNDRTEACVWTRSEKGGEYALKILPGGHLSFALAMSPNGRFAVGYSYNGEHVPTLWLWNRGEKRWILIPLTHQKGKALSVNDDADVVGYVLSNDGEEHAFIWDKEGLRRLGVLSGHLKSRALGINNKGLVVGYSQEPPLADGGAGRQRAFLYDPAVGMRRLFATDTTDAFSINGVGQIVGNYADEREDPEEEIDRAYIWTPKKDE